MSWSLVIQGVISATLGFGVAYARLTKNFRGAPLRSAFTIPGAFYVIANALVSCAVFVVVVKAGFRFGVEKGAPTFNLGLARVLASGLGAPLLLRSSLASVRVGDLDLDPGGFINSIFDQASKAVDRVQAVRGLERDYLDGLDFERDCVPLIELLHNSLQLAVLEEDSPEDFGQRMGELTKRDELPERVKLRILQFELVKRAGERAVRAAAGCLRDEALTRRKGESGQHSGPGDNSAGRSAVEATSAADQGQAGHDLVSA